MASKVNIRVDQGSTYTHEFTWIDEQTETEINISGYSARWQIRPSVESDTLLLDGDTDTKGMIEIADGVAGLVVITIPSAISEAWDSGITEAVYDVEIESPSGESTRIAEGGITISPEVTRSQPIP
jgi:hypothetical protein